MANPVQQQPAQQQPAQQQSPPQPPPPPDVRGAIQRRLQGMVAGGNGVPVQVVPADGAVMLARVPDGGGVADDVTRALSEYFRFAPRSVVHEPQDPDARWRATVLPNTVRTIQAAGSVCWPTDALELRGTRGLTPAPLLQRVFVGDLVWLFYWERMGAFRMLGALLDDYATRGRYPLRTDDASTVYFETMVRLTKMGLSSSIRDRDSSYRRCLGWTSEAGRNLGLNSITNTAFNTQFHRFLELALTYYKEKRVINAIYIEGNQGTPNLATLESIMEALRLLQAAMLPFAYGRNVVHTVTGAVWLVGALDLVKRVRQHIGVPAGFDTPYQYIPAAIEVLLSNGSPEKAASNRYTLHKQCAETGRAILLDIDGLEDSGNLDNDYTRPEVLKTWLDSIEATVEAYRAAYRAAIGADVGTPAIAIEQ